MLGGLISVNGATVKDLFFQVNEGKDIVTLGGKQVTAQSNVYYMLNKPKGVISAVSTKHGEQTVTDLIADEASRIFPVGRLDKDSEGLIFLTNDGDFALKLTHPRYGKEKSYEAAINRKISSKEQHALERGVGIGDGEVSAPAQVRLLIYREGKHPVYLVTIKEGKNRQVRRMFEAIGASVVSLKRVSEGGVSLSGLKAGEYRKLTKKEVALLMSDAKPNTAKSQNSGEKKRKPANRQNKKKQP